MEGFDARKAEQVWQRVQSRETPPLRKSPAELIPLCVAQYDRYQRLCQSLPGKYAQQLQKYACRLRKNTNLLRGLCHFSGLPVPSAQQEPSANAPHLLNTCIREEKRLVELYAALCPDANWGMVYRCLATEAMERCRGLLEILGEMS